MPCPTEPARQSRDDGERRRKRAQYGEKVERRTEEEKKRRDHMPTSSPGLESEPPIFLSFLPRDFFAAGVVINFLYY